MRSLQARSVTLEARRRSMRLMDAASRVHEGDVRLELCNKSVRLFSRPGYR